ncbi:MAG TPA: hypothetical protein VF710_19690 [Longimicrobium sp.]|jgi:hypothetical protein
MEKLAARRAVRQFDTRVHRTRSDRTDRGICSEAAEDSSEYDQTPIHGGRNLLGTGEDAVLIALLKGFVELVLSAADLGGNIKTTAHVIQRAYRALLPRTLRFHHSELRRRLNRMPFIYRGDEADIEHDYVVARLAPIDPDTLAPMDVERTTGESALVAGTTEVAELEMKVAFLMVRHHRLALIVGSAGMGKTTFSSHSILNAITRHDITSGFYPFKPNERLVPFFVPLKAVDENDDYPILRYLFRTNSYLRGPFGLRRFKKLIEKTKILLVLDGYDELYVPETGISRVIGDINAIASGTLPPFSAGLNMPAEYRHFYENMASCRLWLTTRNDFYRENRLIRDTRERTANKRWLENYYIEFTDAGLNERFYRDHPGGFATVGIVGVQSKEEIISRIFNRYRRRDPQTYSWLHASTFLRLMEQEFDEETLRLSDNPLFLTVICYMYIKQEEQGAKVPRQRDRSSLTELILGCAKLLLVEADKQKLHGITADIPLSRRLRYKEEKLAFLQYFAARTFSDETLFRRNVFRVSDLYAAAEEYFRSDTSPHDLVTGIRRRTRDNVVRMLITQGVFVVVDEHKGEVLYDFPHRRFREVLAVQYLDNLQHVDECIALAGEVRYREFLLVFFASSASYQDRILSALLERCDDSLRGEYYINLVGDCLAKRPPSYSPSPVLERWVLHAVSQLKLDRIPEPMVRHIQVSNETVAWLSFQVSTAARMNTPSDLRRYAVILGQLASGALLTLVAEHLSAEEIAEPMVDELIDVLRTDHLEDVQRLLVRGANSVFPRLMSRIVGVRNAPRDVQWWRNLMMDLSAERRDLLLKLAGEGYPRLSVAITKWLSEYRLYNELRRLAAKEEERSEKETHEQSSRKTGAKIPKARKKPKGIELPVLEEFWI